ncbi:hypothetical protein KBD20_00510 [Candidatus Saccharibacteria bacterium]|nr:hypothetical protein [Candidatus Saccharibacteria bacterium]
MKTNPKSKKKFLWLIPLFAIVALVAACTDAGPKEGSTQDKSQAETEEYSSAAIKAVPYPMEAMKAGGWLERKNLSERLQRYADPNKLSYIYLFSAQGQLMGNYTVKGKVSSASSQMSTATQVIDGCGRDTYCAFGVEAPMDDGTWGPSEDAIFFFTTDGVMVQWTGEYVLSDAPLDMTSKPLLVYNEGSKPSSVGDESSYGGN